MELNKIVDKLGLTAVAGTAGLSKDAQSGYVSDLLSDVMANAKAGSVWVTIQTHANIIAVCTLNEVAAIIIAGGKQPSPDTIAKADAEGVPILTSPASSFEVVGQLYKLGIHGRE